MGAQKEIDVTPSKDLTQMREVKQLQLTPDGQQLTPDVTVSGGELFCQTFRKSFYLIKCFTFNTLQPYFTQITNTHKRNL